MVEKTDLDAQVHVVADRDWDRESASAFDVLRAVLAAHLDREPTDVPLTRRCERCGSTDHGRPRVAGDRIDVGLAHSGPVLVLAVARDTRVGIDVEIVRDRSQARVDRLAARVLGDRELVAWRALPVEERPVAFLRAWTTKEAYLKALGVGLGRPLRETDPIADGWHVHPVDDLVADAVVTVVTERPARIDAAGFSARGPRPSGPCRHAHP